jgi:tetrahydromethanopterin S-methyltransferase subunit G
VDAALRADVEQLHQRLGEVDAMQGRMAELEERLDFTERLLAQSREPDRLQR